ncbi:MAG: transcription antitermination factor NusB [SAR324 cluster bacterium]|nr:transcription antitermination factor NusB [SAR324 cluster bacterium]
MKETPRRRTRLFALQILFSRAQLGVSPAREMLLAKEYKLKEDNIQSAKDLANFAWENLKQVDGLIAENLENWSQDRLVLSLSSLLRLSVGELISTPELDAKVVINEAMGICESHADAGATSLLNGVLHKVSVKLGRIS